MLQKIINELDKRISTQLKIMAGVNDEIYRYGFRRSLEAYQQSRMIVEEYTEPMQFLYPNDDQDGYKCPSCGEKLFEDNFFGELDTTRYCINCGQRLCK